MGRKSKRLHGPAEISGNGGNTAGRHYKAGIYARLSVKKDEKNESIDVQVEIAKRFADSWNVSHGDKIEVIDCYKDLGKTGTSFERDEFKRLMQDVRLGSINCVIVKDLSRFGRNYLEAGNYIEKIFPFLGVRFIAVADGYDTVAEGSHAAQMATEIKNLVNDMYAKDFSAKARLSLDQRRKEGSYVGGPPPYGYKAVWEGKRRRLVPDGNTAKIIRHIYYKFIETESYKAVADDLNKSRINPPSVYRKSGEVYCPPDKPYKGWDKGYIEVLLRNEIYIGRLAQGKTGISQGEVFQAEVSRGGKAQVEASPSGPSAEKEKKRAGEEVWEVKEQAHEPLIEQEIFGQAREVWQKMQKRREGYKHLTGGCPVGADDFEGVLFCGMCGRKMTRHSHVRSYADGSKRRVEEYFCIDGAVTKTESCQSPNFITKNQLVSLLFPLLGTEFAVALKSQKEYGKRGKDILAAKKKEFESALHAVHGKKREFEGQDSAAYMAYRMGKLSQEELAAAKRQRDAGMRELLDREAAIQEAVRKLEKKEKIFLSEVRAHERASTKELAAALIDRIYVYPGKRVEVVFAYEDVFRKKGAAE